MSPLERSEQDAHSRGAIRERRRVIINKIF
jgi:hypothetical protein